MIYLEKTNKDAIDHVSKFIRGNWLDQGNGIFKYQNIGYSDIKNPANDFRKFFVCEQNRKCCYCCQDIANDNTTELEHIIPRAKHCIEEFAPYYILSGILKQNVVPQSLFETATGEQDMPPFPHHIAYHNIITSCNGRTVESSEDVTCCNRKRGDDFIPPFNLMKNSVGYLPDGTIVYLKELKNRDYFEILNLNKETLRNIRRLWYLFSQSILSAQLLDNAVELEEIITVHAIAHSPTPIEDIKLLETFSNQTMWNAFKKYSYFLTYYRTLPAEVHA